MKTHRNLLVWSKSLDFVTKLYQTIATFPSIENYGIGSQIRRAAVSIPSNIAEGASRNTKKEFYRYLSIAVSSATELETQLIICKNVELMSPAQFGPLMADLKEILKLLQGLRNSLK